MNNIYFVSVWDLIESMKSTRTVCVEFSTRPQLRWIARIFFQMCRYTTYQPLLMIWGSSKRITRPNGDWWWWPSKFLEIIQITKHYEDLTQNDLLNFLLFSLFSIRFLALGENGMGFCSLNAEGCCRYLDSGSESKTRSSSPKVQWAMANPGFCSSILNGVGPL